MSKPRALANQKLYHAKILIDAWRQALQQEQVASRVLEPAFGEAVCDHLAAAYGWFLLEVAQPAQIPDKPPRRCAELPAVEEGLTTAPEILEFIQLEREPWLERVLDTRAGGRPLSTEPESVPPVPRSLAVVSLAESFDPEEALQTHDKLQQLFDRMTDSLDEY